ETGPGVTYPPPPTPPPSNVTPTTGTTGTTGQNPPPPGPSTGQNPPPATGQNPTPGTTQPPRPNPGTVPVNPYYQKAYQSSLDREGRYGWALGVSLGFVHQAYQDSTFKDTGLNLDVDADLLLWRNQRIGIRPSINFSLFGKRDASSPSALSLADVGAALFWHLRLGDSSFYITPAAGVSVAFFNFTDDNASYIGAGIRLEAAVDWVIGNRHVISLVPALSVYPQPGQLSGTTLY